VKQLNGLEAEGFRLFEGALARTEQDRAMSRVSSGGDRQEFAIPISTLPGEIEPGSDRQLRGGVFIVATKATEDVGPAEGVVEVDAAGRGAEECGRRETSTPHVLG
jgi:hypothetical protein